MNTNDLNKAIKNRRSCYSIDNHVKLTAEQIKEIIDFAVLHVPSAFNSQSTRIVTLFGTQHKKLWDITKEKLKKITSEEQFKHTEAKIDNCFGAGFGTVLFFEDQAVAEKLQKQFPLYGHNFPIWSEQTSAMHQFAIWTMLENEGLGASLQHYNPLIDEEVAKTWKIDSKWKLIAQMPFGNPLGDPELKDFESLEERSLMFE